MNFQKIRNADAIEAEKNDPLRLVQITALTVPVFAVYAYGDEQELRFPILFAGLQQNGDPVLFDLAADGMFCDPTIDSNFLRYET